MCMYQLPMMNVITVYCNYVLIKIRFLKICPSFCVKAKDEMPTKAHNMAETQGKNEMNSLQF